MLRKDRRKFLKWLTIITIFSSFLIILWMNQENNNNNSFPDKIPDGFGVNVHFNGDPIDVDLIEDAGFKIVRKDLFWDNVEKERGKYDFTKYDQLTNALIKEGIRPYYILAYSNTLYEANRSIVTKEGQEAFARYAEEATSRYKNKGIIWEIWNEPNIGFWEPKPNFNEYSSLVKKVSKVIKENDPSGVVVAPALSGLNEESLKWLEEIFKEGILDYIDAVSVHPYRVSNPETVGKDYQSLRELIDKYTNKEIAIISGEWGYSTAKGWNGLELTEKEQADYLVRMFFVNLLYDVPISIWYDWKNDGIDSNNGEHNFGLREHNVIKPKKGYMAINTLTYILSGYKLNERINIGDPDDYMLEFINENEDKVIVFWTSRNKQKTTLPLRVEGRVVSVLGEEKGYLKNKTTIELSSSPNYLILDN
ncbi:cellulase family glycosylhydrolase [Metabacillus sp. FJAT-53654]|uniref:Cellulase family glycosylhydrolase n=1 Tax=Metabacillus rhizosphaerae TaxID=3117747 RepID=A0ABZ2MYB8_9BACI